MAIPDIALEQPALALPRKRIRWSELVVQGLLFTAAAISVLTTLGIVFSLLQPALEFFTEISPWEFFTGTTWAPLFLDARFGVVPLVVGTFVISFWSALVAFPLGLGVAIYLSEYARPRVTSVLKPILEILAAIPTVVLGYFALTFVTPLLRDIGLQVEIFNALAASLVLGVMLIPTVATLSEDAMAAVPRDLRDGGYALGADKLQVSTQIVVPAAVSGIIAAFVLAFSRAVGETMIVLIAAGQLAQITFDPRETIETMTAFIGATGNGDVPTGSIEYKTIFAVGLTLFVITLDHEPDLDQARPQVPGDLRVSTLDAPLQSDRSDRKWKNRAFSAAMLFSMLVAFGTLAVLLVDTIVTGWPAIQWALFSDPPSTVPEEAGARPAILATLYLGFLVLILSVPIGVLTAIYLEEYANRDRWWNRLIEVNIQNLAAVPSIVYGILGLAFIVRGIGVGRVVFAGALILTLVVLPTVVVSSREAIRAVPDSIRQGAFALGATKWQVVWRQVLPASIPGIATGSILALSRAVGETAPLIMVGAITYVAFNPELFGAYTALPVQIYNWTKQPDPGFQTLAAAAAIVLLAIVLTMNAVAIFLRNRYRKQW